MSPPEPNTSVVPDATRINPPVLRPEFRNGHDISLSVSLDAGVPIQNLSVANHRAEIDKQGVPSAGKSLSAVPFFRGSLRQTLAGTSTRGLARGRRTITAAGFAGGGGGFGGSVKESLFELKYLAEGEEDFRRDAWIYLPRLSAEQATPVSAAAQQAFDAGAKFERDGKFAEAREALTRSYLLDTALLNGVQVGGEIAAEAVRALDRVHTQQVKAWTAKNSALGNKLDLVIRDKSLAESLEMVRAAAGIEIELLDGSAADAAKLTHDSARVNYLDLRRATVAQALDWILHPRRMSWRIEQDTVIAGTDRRRPGPSAWVYDVSLLLPSATELQNAGDDSTNVVAKAAEALVTSLRVQLSVEGPLSIVWFSPGHLLVVGDLDRHASVDKWMGEQIRATAATLATQRKIAAEASAAAHGRQDIASVHASAAWQLLAAAAGGELDLEALTELQIAWRSEQTTELLEGKSAAVVLRSLWCVAEAARALPGKAELNSLANAARRKSLTATTAAFEVLDKNRDDASAFASVLYAALAMRDDPQFTDKAVRLLTIACRRSGSEAWSAFRREATDLLANQPLAGSVLVLINRLNAPQIELAAAVQ